MVKQYIIQVNDNILRLIDDDDGVCIISIDTDKINPEIFFKMVKAYFLYD